MRTMKRTCLLLCALLACAAAQAGDARIGAVVAAPCAACHGAGGAAPIGNYPILAGQDEDYLLYAMRAYKSGARANAVMAAQMAPFSRRDMENLAAYFAGQPSAWNTEPPR